MAILPDSVANILVIDDDFTSRYLVQDLLQSMGMGDSILTASSGFEALAMLRELLGTAAFPNYIILDIVMPQMDGFDFLEELEELSPPNISGTKIIILSYYASRKYRELAQLYPVTAFIQKPLTESKVQQAFRMS